MRTHITEIKLGKVGQNLKGHWEKTLLPLLYLLLRAAFQLPSVGTNRIELD